MNEPTRIIDITGAHARIVEPEWLVRSEAVHRQLRPQLPADYSAKMQRVFAGGAGMCVAVRGDAVVGVAVHRIHENTFAGVQMYVDDLVTDETCRSSGVGRALMQHLRALARRGGCSSLQLDSGTQRQQAHKFYFREGMVVSSFHFSQTLERVDSSHA